MKVLNNDKMFKIEVSLGRVLYECLYNNEINIPDDSRKVIIDCLFNVCNTLSPNMWSDCQNGASQLKRFDLWKKTMDRIAEKVYKKDDEDAY